MGAHNVSGEPVAIYQANIYGKTPKLIHITNLDVNNPIYYSDTPTITPQSAVLYPLGSANFDGTHDVWCSTLDDTINVSIQTGIRGQRSWTAGLNTPPQVLDIQSVVAINIDPADSPYVMFPFPQTGRIWGINLSGSVISNGAVNTRTYDLVQLDGLGIPGDGTPLAILEQAAINAVAVDSDSLYIPFNGMMVAKNKTVYLIVNGGNTVTNAILTASAVLFYSIP